MKNYIRLKFLFIENYRILGKGNIKNLEKDLLEGKILYCSYIEKEIFGYSMKFIEYPGLILHTGFLN